MRSIRIHPLLSSFLFFADRQRDRHTDADERLISNRDARDRERERERQAFRQVNEATGERERLAAGKGCRRPDAGVSLPA